MIKFIFTVFLTISNIFAHELQSFEGSYLLNDCSLPGTKAQVSLEKDQNQNYISLKIKFYDNKKSNIVQLHLVPTRKFNPRNAYGDPTIETTTYTKISKNIIIMETTEHYDNGYQNISAVTSLKKTRQGLIYKFMGVSGHENCDLLINDPRKN